jgi:hypothetical protein
LPSSVSNWLIGFDVLLLDALLDVLLLDVLSLLDVLLLAALLSLPPW